MSDWLLVVGVFVQVVEIIVIILQLGINLIHTCFFIISVLLMPIPIVKKRKFVMNMSIQGSACNA